MLLSLIAISISVFLLVLLAYRGWSVLLLSPILALAVVLATNDGHVLATYTHIFMRSLGEFVITYFPIFLLSAIFGKLMAACGFANVIAKSVVRAVGVKRAVVSVALASAILTYGGVSLFVVVFAVYPIAVELFHAASIPKRFIPASIALGAFTFTMTALPGTPSIQNIIPCEFFKTTSFAAPGIGIIASLVIWCFGIAWLNRRIAGLKDKEKGNDSSKVVDVTNVSETSSIHWSVALLPIFCVIALNFYFVNYYFTGTAANALNDIRYGGVDLSKVASNWSILAALFCSIMLTVVLNFRGIKKLITVANDSVQDALAPIFNTAAVVGYGAVIGSLSGFKMITDMIVNICPTIPTISSVISTTLLSGITGSASGGMMIALKSLGSIYLQRAIEYGVSPELLHRVVAIASGCLDTLPHNGAVITLLAICGVTHRESYNDIFVTTIVIPIIAVTIAIGLGHVFGSF